MLNFWSKAGLPASLLLVAATLFIAGAVINSAAATASTHSISIGAPALGQYLARHPDKLSIVLVSTPGCGLCKLVRERQLAPLLRDPDFKDVAVFEVLMRDDTQFVPTIKAFSNHTGSSLGSIGSPAILSTRLGIDLAPTVLFLGDSSELAERLVGYGVPDYYFAYLSERIDEARDQLIHNKQK